MNLHQNAGLLSVGCGYIWHISYRDVIETCKVRTRMSNTTSAPAPTEQTLFKPEPADAPTLFKSPAVPPKTNVREFPDEPTIQHPENQCPESRPWLMESPERSCSSSSAESIGPNDTDDKSDTSEVLGGNEIPRAFAEVMGAIRNETGFQYEVDEKDMPEIGEHMKFAVKEYVGKCFEVAKFAALKRRRVTVTSGDLQTAECILGANRTAESPPEDERAAESSQEDERPAKQLKYSPLCGLSVNPHIASHAERNSGCFL